MNPHIVKKAVKRSIMAASLLSMPLLSFGQAQPPENWHHQYNDTYKGIGTEQAYQQYLADKPAKKVVVAVIDSGIDVEHEDLKDVIWKNTDEVAGNGVDDDNNGFVDDVHGWNFIGGADGQNIGPDTYEVTREYKRLRPLYEGKAAKDFRRKADRREFEYYQDVKEAYEQKIEDSELGYQNYKNFYDGFIRAKRLMAAYVGVEEEELTAEMLSDINSPDEKIAQSAQLIQYAASNGLDEEGIKDGLDYFENRVKYGLNLDFDPRDIVGDDPNNPNEVGYGNTDVTGPDSQHGTHVAGIIAAARNNNVGMDGVANSVEIMVLRAVPDGDERDKDIAAAIRYAVDNGASVINMSFGKDFSPQKELVDAAVAYAEKNDVLIVHAAGNDGKNLDNERNYPQRTYLNSNRTAKNWLEIGASSWGKAPDNFVADFSNYGDRNVDVFAPGVAIYSTVPGSEYERLGGTSMAAPVVAGVAALLRSYYPNLSAAQVREIIMSSATSYENVKVAKPGSDNTIDFGKLSVAGGIVNAAEAMKMAETMSTSRRGRR
jgi:subtilisin family serine protease